MVNSFSDTCVASGDPHINTFDCVQYEYHGKCDYTLVKSCADGVESFEITADFERMRYHNKLSVIKSLQIVSGGTVSTLLVF